MGSTVRVLRFGTDGVRGGADSDLTPDVVHALGRAVATVLGTDLPFLLARDTRQSGPGIEAAFAAGLGAAGAGVESLGVFPTPGLAYVSSVRALPAAMISASHNPYADNGIKVFAPGGRKLADETEQRIEAEMATLTVPATSAGSAIPPPPTDAADREAYVAHLVDALEGRSLDGLHVLIDCAHGAAYEVAPEVFRRLGARVDVRAADPDGRNINAGCGSTHPDVAQAGVRETGADIGLALDGDADRLIAVDEGGSLVDGDHILAIAALDLLERGRLKNDTVVTTVMANLGFRRAMDVHGVKIVETKVGDRYVLEALDDGGCSLGGEQSGHLIFSDLATTGDGILSALVVLDVMRRAGRPLSELASVVQKLPQVLRNVGVANRQGLEEAYAFWGEVSAVEAELGAQGRVLVRPSGTEPLVRVMVEAPTMDEAAHQADRLSQALVSALGAPDS